MTFSIMSGFSKPAVLIIILILSILVDAFVLAFTARLAYGLSRVRLSRGLLQWAMLLGIRIIIVFAVLLFAAAIGGLK